MAVANVQPTMDVKEGMADLEQDIPRVLTLLGASSLEELGWQQPDKLSLLIPMTGVHAGLEDRYLLRLGFQAYRKWPPSAQFVNPETKSYVYPQDQHFVPRLVSSECQTHVAYQQRPDSNKIQLICCSATLEFYEVLHPVESHHIWQETNTFFTTIAAIQKAMTSFYQGRFPADGR